MNKKCIILLLMMFAVSAEAGERLDGNALKEFWEEKTIVGVHHKHGSIKTYHGADGTAHSVAERGKVRKGKWWIDEASNKKCIEWSHNKKRRCHYTESNGDGTYTLIHGKNGKRLVEISAVLDGNQL
ncbi:MAG: hypothetical protein MI756_12115 [Chromatiales bacterium]|nr:hypothetical protein [Chromatiales bacterium]